MEQLALREPVFKGYVDPLSIVPNPGEMGQLYIDMRRFYADGMSLACAAPKPGKTYDTIVHEYTDRGLQDAGEEAAFAFWEANFDTPEPDMGVLVAPDGMDIDEYSLLIRDRFIFPPKDEDSCFDLWLPYSRSVAGAGRFGKHSFLWDGYHMAKGYAADDRWDLVRDIVDNTEYQILTYHYPFNGSAHFYASRPQIPYFSHEVRLMADRFGPEALIRYRHAMETEYEKYWMKSKDKLLALPDDGKAHADHSLVRMPDGSFLNRYWDDWDGPRLESFKEDHDLGKLVVHGLKGAIREKRLQKLYKDVRAAAASGWDFSSRWFEDPNNIETINTTDIAPPDLNSLMEYTEETLAMAYDAEADTYIGINEDEEQRLRAKADEYWSLAGQRIATMTKYLYNPTTEIFHDYNFVQGRMTDVVSAAAAYPMYVGITTADQTFGTARMIKRKLLRPGGIATTANHGLDNQWDGEERVWAPTNWAVARGLARMAHILMEDGVEVEWLFELAEEVKNNYVHGGIEEVYDEWRIIPEKHHGVTPRVLANGGEYALVKALGMSGETYRAMKKWNPREPDKTRRPIGRAGVRPTGRAAVRPMGRTAMRTTGRAKVAGGNNV